MLLISYLNYRNNDIGRIDENRIMYIIDDEILVGIFDIVLRILNDLSGPYISCHVLSFLVNKNIIGLNNIELYDEMK